MEAKAVLHLLAALHFWFACFYDWTYVIIPPEIDRLAAFGTSSKLKYLTNWDGLLQSLFFTIAFANDLVGSNELSPRQAPRVRKIRDMMFSCLAFPVSMFVGLTFWGIYAVDREMVLPKVLDEFFPGWLNHAMHTHIMVFILIELFTSHRYYPSRRVGLSVLFGFKLSYLVWMHIIHARTGMWVYPLFDVLNLPARVLFFVALFGLDYALYVFGERLNEIAWRSRLAANEQKEH